MPIKNIMRLISWLSGPIGTTLRYALSVVAIGWLVWRLKSMGWHSLELVDWSLATPAMVMAGLAYPLQAWRWQILLRALGLKAQTRWVHCVFWIGNFYNSFLPGGVAGDAVRLSYLWRAEPNQKALGAASLIVDRLIGLGVLCALTAFVLVMHFMFGSFLNTSGFHGLLALSIGVCLALLIAGWSIVGTRWFEPLSTRILGVQRARSLHDATIALGQKHAALASAILISVAVWLADFLSLLWLAQSVGLSVGWLAMAVAAAAAYLAAIIPISIGGHGVREGTLVGMLMVLGVGSNQTENTALLALLFLALTIGSSLVGGCIYLVTLMIGWPISSASKQ